jgi:uncharacterized protein YwqG
MTPSEQLAQKRLEALQFIADNAPESLRDHLGNFLRPAIGLQLQPNPAEPSQLGDSHFGGVPDVPEDFYWPDWDGIPLGFVAQLNLQEFAAYEVGFSLPKTGLLSFFVSFDDELQVWGDAEHRPGWRVFYWNGEHLRRSEAAQYEKPLLPEFSVKPIAAWTLPCPNEDEMHALLSKSSSLFSEEDRLDYMSFYNDFCESFSTFNRIGGWPDTFQEPMGPQCQTEFKTYIAAQDMDDYVESEQWQFLFQLDSQTYDENWWPYVGLIYFWIRPEELYDGDFSNTWLMQQVN